MTAVKLAFVLGAALLAAACLPVTTEAPLGTTVAPGAEPVLLGTWKGRVGDNEEGPSYFHILPATDGTETVLVVTPAHGKNKGSWSEFAARAVTLGSYRYLDIRSISSDGKPAGKDEAARNIPVFYKLGHGTLTLYLIGEKAAKDAIESGRIEGMIEPGDYGDITLTAAPEKLDAFFASPDGAKLFTDKLAILKKVE